MTVKIGQISKVFVACPANFATGGPELLHQLAYHFVNDLNISAFMYYYNFDDKKFKTPVHPEYEFYKVPYVLEISKKEDIEENILIVPEILDGLLLLPKYKNIRKGVWFLSVDNYYSSRITKKDFFSQRAFNKLARLFHKQYFFDIYSETNLKKMVKKHNYRNDNLLQLADFYMTNSYRGMQWFKDLKPLYYIPDFYVNIQFIQESLKISLTNKKNIVLYNPKKGFQFTKKIIRLAKDISFIPIQGMRRNEVINLMKEAKVYIDFGHFPGPERIPKEAAILGCCVITSKRGSAAFFEDVSIPDEYKFEDRKENIPKIIEKIKDCFENFEERYENFDYYRQIIKNGPQKFIDDLRNTFIKVEQ